MFIKRDSVKERLPNKLNCCVQWIQMIPGVETPCSGTVPTGIEETPLKDLKKGF